MEYCTGHSYTRLKTDFTSITDGKYSFRTQTADYIGIPLDAIYNIWNNSNISLYSSVSVKADIPFCNDKTWQWSISSSAGLQYKLTTHISIFAEPSFFYHLNSSHSTPTIWTDRPFNITIPLGIRFSW